MGREVLRKRFPSSETLSRALSNLFRPEKEKRPLVIAFYLTFDCNARCDFCSQGEFVYGRERGRYRNDQQLDKQLEVLRVIRRDVPNIYFLGGEPTVYPGFERILEESSDLDFDTITVNSNALLFKPEILAHAHSLLVSLHSMDPTKIASIYRVAPKRGVQALENIRKYAHERDSRMQMTVNSVITSDTIDEVYGIAEFCRELGIQLNVAPAILEGGRPDSRLIGNPKYMALIDWLLSQDGLMASSRAYLKIIKDFQPFACTPYVVPGVHPNGDMIVPCPNLPEGKKMVNILTAGGVHKALDIGRAQFEAKHGILDTQRRCAEMCHKACYVEGANVSTIGGLVRIGREKIAALIS